MDSGIHIGLAAWLHHRCDGQGFPAWPGAPVPLRLARLERAASPDDMARLAEFARLVNFVARPGAAARPFDPVPLWRVHSDLLGRMEFARRAWTEAENAAFAAARAVLYGADGKTALYRLYLECRAAYQDLLASGADPEALRHAAVAWELEGGRIEIEAALATIERLAARSSLSAATAERDALYLLPVDPAGASYAMTGYAPISVLDDAGWISASVGLADIDGAVALAPQRETASWTGWRRGRTGTLAFRYAILQIDRDWFSPQIYRADDWRLPGTDRASDGAGGGTLPAYPARLYAVRDVALHPDPPRPPSQSPALSVSAGHVLRAGLRTGLPSAVGPIAALSAAPPKSLPRRMPDTVILAQPVLPAKLRPAPAPATVATMPVTGRLTLSADAVRRLDPGIIQSVTHLTVARRLAVARDLVAPVPPAGPAPRDPTLWAVGFGCESLPKAPNPHAGYGWA